MFVNSLEHAIKLIELGESLEAQKILKQLIQANRHDLASWFWLLETCSTNEQRIEVLNICLEYNPDSEPVQQALERFQSPLPPKLLVSQSTPVHHLNASSMDISNSGFKLIDFLPFLFAVPSLTPGYGIPFILMSFVWGLVTKSRFGKIVLAISLVGAGIQICGWILLSNFKVSGSF